MLKNRNLIVEDLLRKRQNKVDEAYIRNLYTGTEVDDLFNSKKPKRGDVFIVNNNFKYFGWIANIETPEDAKKRGIEKLSEYDEYKFPKGTKLTYDGFTGGPGGGYEFILNDSDARVMFVMFNTEDDNPKTWINLVAKKSYE